MTLPTLIIGSGASALAAADQLLTVGQPLILLSPSKQVNGSDPALIDRITSEAEAVFLEARLVECRGQAGGFEITFLQHDNPGRQQVGAIVIAVESDHRCNLYLYGLRPSASIRSLSEFRTNHETAPQSSRERTIVWINGVAEENSTVVFEEMLHCAMKSQMADEVRGCFLTANLKVAGNGLEARQREAKANGISFFKLDRPADLKIDQTDGRATLKFKDASTGETFTLSPDEIVVDETLVSSPYLESLAKVMRLHTDPEGFLQTENVHRLPVYTNRRGILAVGSARGIMTKAAAAVDAAAAAAVINRTPPGFPTEEESAVIDTGACIRCLTCFRLCPHVAVEKGHRMSVASAACEACGLCVVECPRRAIELGPAGLGKNATQDTLAAGLVVLSCRQSAIPALKSARERNLPLPENLAVVEVPCTGGVSLQLVLDAFVRGAEGVMVMGCHTGNCRSEIGSDYCRRRIEMLARQLPALGVSETRLAMRTIAANMAADAARIVGEFAEEIKNPGQRARL